MYLHEFVLDMEELFSTARVFVFDPRFCFLDLCTRFVDLASTGGEPFLICTHFGADVVLDLGTWFLDLYNFSWDLRTQRMVVGILILGQDAGKKFLRQEKSDRYSSNITLRICGEASGGTLHMNPHRCRTLRGQGKARY